MHKKLIWGASALASLFISVVHAADLAVTAKVIPSACILAVDDAGVVDYGEHLMSILSDNSWTDLGEKNLGYTIQCQNATFVGLKIIDNRLGSDSDASGNDAGRYGLGYVHGERIGNYEVVSHNLILNGQAGRHLVTEDLRTWTMSGAAAEYRTDVDMTVSYAHALSATTPLAVSSLSGTLEINTEIGASREFDLSRAIELDGSATMELNYL